MKKKIIILSILIGPFSWLYTYEKDRRKLWASFVLSIITLGAWYVLIAWPWSVINALTRPGSAYDVGSLTGTSVKYARGLKFLAFVGGVLYSAIMVGVMCLMSVWIVYLQFDYETVNSSSKYWGGRLCFWATFWVVVGGIIIVNRLGKYSFDYLARITRKSLITLLIFVLIFGWGGTLWIFAGPLADDPSSCDISEVLQNAIGATYPIATDQGTGTAYAINANGELVTAYHVIEGANRVYLNLSSGEVDASVLRIAPEYDLALIKIPQQTSVFLAATDLFEPSDTVYALGWPGNAYDVGAVSVSAGVVSRVVSEDDMRSSGINAPSGLKLVQTDAAINPGNSGGPLIGACGLIGTVTAKSDTLGLQDYGLSSEEGISYVISSQTVKMALGL